MPSCFGYYVQNDRACLHCWMNRQCKSLRTTHGEVLEAARLELTVEQFIGDIEAGLVNSGEFRQHPLVMIMAREGLLPTAPKGFNDSTAAAPLNFNDLVAEEERARSGIPTPLPPNVDLGPLD